MARILAVVAVAVLGVFAFGGDERAQASEQNGFDVDGIVICGDSSWHIITVQTELSGDYDFVLGGVTYLTGYELAEAVDCETDYKIYRLTASVLFIDCEPGNVFTNGGMTATEVEASTFGTIGLPADIFVVPNGPTTGPFASIEDFYASKRVNCFPKQTPPATF